MIAGYARVSTSQQSREGQVEAIKDAYPDATIHADVASGDDEQRRGYRLLRQKIEDGDVEKVVATRLDRLGRTTLEVADLVDLCSDEGVGIHLVNQGIDADPDDTMGQMMLKVLGIVAEMELQLNRERRQEGIERAIDRGVHFGPAPHGTTKDEMGALQPAEGYERVQYFIHEVSKGRPKRPTARFFAVPEGSIASILEQAEEVYDVPFDNDQWVMEAAKVETGQKELEPLPEKYPALDDDGK